MAGLQQYSKAKRNRLRHYQARRPTLFESEGQRFVLAPPRNEPEQRQCPLRQPPHPTIRNSDTRPNTAAPR